jgi:NADH-ubiquinone oxidoreductase chain 5
MLVLILVLPFLSFSSILFGSAFGLGMKYITVICIFLTFLFSISLFYKVVLTGCVYKLTLGTWFSSEFYNLTWSFCFDSLTVTMLCVVTFISFLVHLYSLEYMSSDPHLPRFLAYLSLFTWFMLILVTGNNFLQLFVGWEGVGLSSYLLINFWFTRIQANKAAIKAMLVNRVGDFFLLLALFGLYFSCNSLDYDIVFTLAPLLATCKYTWFGYDIHVLDFICCCLFLGAMGKSAQIGLHTWLPDAMEGPTPVSALIHAATMVTAGVFLLARCSFLFEFSPLILILIMVIGATTAFFAATTGLFQNDIKKVIAYSTCSQLGYMIFACGLSSYEAGIFHLSNHAFFKALLFLGAGSIIHAVSDEQDMRKMGGLKLLLPFSYSIMVIGSLALIGFPFFSGFYSKDTILELAFAKQTVIGHFCYALGTTAAFFTAFYSTRLLFLVFLSSTNSVRVSIKNALEGSFNLGVPLFILSFFSIGIGFLTKDLFIGFGTPFWGSAIFVLPQNYLFTDIEFISLFFKLLPLFLTLLGVTVAYGTYTINIANYYNVKKTKGFKFIYNFLSRKWFFDRIYNQIFSQGILSFSYFYTYKIVDRGILEILGPLGILTLIPAQINRLKGLQTGHVLHYFFYFFNAFLFLLFLICNV